MLRKVLNLAGALILVLLLMLVLPLTVPRLFGFQLYEIQTGSMVPALPVHSVIYVRLCEADAISVDDVITFRLESGSDQLMTHRVVDINEETQSFTTKGDANEAVDQTPVPFQNVTGKVLFHIPMLGTLAAALKTGPGLAACAAVFAVVVILWVLADRLKVKEREQ